MFHGINKDTFILYLVSMLYVNLVVLTVCRLNPESEFNIKSNQINLFKLGEEWLPEGSCIKRASIPGRIGI